MLTATLILVTMLIFVLISDEVYRPGCPNCGGRRWHHRTCPDREGE